jgi:hypothetical protein
MNKFITASLLLVFLVVLQTNAFAASMKCNFKDIRMNGVNSIQINDESLIINDLFEIPMEKSRVKCGNFGKQVRFDGRALGYQVVLKSCTTDAKLEGHLIDAPNSAVADILCNNID